MCTNIHSYVYMSYIPIAEFGKYYIIIIIIYVLLLKIERRQFKIWYYGYYYNFSRMENSRIPVNNIIGNRANCVLLHSTFCKFVK